MPRIGLQIASGSRGGVTMFRRSGLVRIAGLAFAAGCGGSASVDPPSRIYGEVHIHEFNGGAHPGALFVMTPVPTSATSGDSLFPAKTTSESGNCSLTLSWAVAEPDTFPRLVDGGLVRIRNGNTVSEVDLVFDGTASTYVPMPPLPPGIGIFTGGEQLLVSGAGAVAPTFAGSVAAPQPLVLTEPATLSIDPGADLSIRWVPGDAEQVDAALVVSTEDGRIATIDCVAPDQAGQLALPQMFVAQLPPRPRDLHLEVGREVVVTARGPGETGVLVHAGYVVSLDGHDP
jgi:hypothetical protein